MNLEQFLDDEMEKTVIEVDIFNEDGSIHNDVDYHLYEVIEVTYFGTNKTRCKVVVRKFK